MKMMKYLLAPSLFLLASTACNGNKKGETSPESTSKEQTKSESASAVNGNGKVLVVFFSHAGDNYAVGNIKVGNTKKIADIIAEKTGADQFEIVAEKNYDMAYGPLTELAKKEQQNGELPAFKGEVENIDQYQTIFIGGPVWWGTYPQVMFTFFKKYDLNGKTLIPFTTHEGSGLGNCVEDVKAAYPNATVKEGLAIRGKDAQEGKATKDVEKWLNGLGF
ncbi:MAG: flavodoxin [Prevotella sp.]|nr:flavodoxin [Prevotella sp.]